MVIGQREESFEEMRLRHINEMEEFKSGWESELRHARKKNDYKYEKYCEFMIQVTDNTINGLKNFNYC